MKYITLWGDIGVILIITARKNENDEFLKNNFSHCEIFCFYKP